MTCTRSRRFFPFCHGELEELQSKGVIKDVMRVGVIGRLACRLILCFLSKQKQGAEYATSAKEYASLDEIVAAYVTDDPSSKMVVTN